MSKSSEYLRSYRNRKKLGNFQDLRFKPTERDICLNCGKLLPERIRPCKPRKYCNNNKCQHEHARKQAIELNIAGNGSVKRFLIETRGHKCESCNNTHWLGEPIPLEMHHLDGDRKNHKPNNVVLYCPNCHSKTDNFKSKNVGKANTISISKPFYPSKLNPL